GLKNKLGNVHFVWDIRKYGFGNSVRFTQSLSESVVYEVDKRIDCPDCDGHYEDDDDYCDTCDNNGYWTVEDDFMPYIDDHDVIGMEADSITFRIPRAYAEKHGILEHVEDYVNPAFLA